MEQTNGVVIYASKYGTTERYAQAFATLMGLPLCDLKQCQALASEPGIEKVYVFCANLPTGYYGTTRDFACVRSG